MKKITKKDVEKLAKALGAGYDVGGLKYDIIDLNIDSAMQATAKSVEASIVRALKEKAKDGIKERLSNGTYNKIWKKADDAIERVVRLSDIYDDVPEELKDVFVHTLELHFIERGKRTKVKKWLNRKE